jgi:hypothetical protein
VTRRLNPQLIKIHRSYTTDELAILLGCHRNTVRLWLRRGLAVLNDGKRPLLIHGACARGFIQKRQLVRRRKCQPDEMYCFRCKEPREPAGAMVDFQQNGKSWLMTGLCADCGVTMCKNVSDSVAEGLRARLDANVVEG